MLNSNQYDYFGYIVSKNGVIETRDGQIVPMDENGCVRLRIDGKRVKKIAGRIIIEAVTGKLTERNDIITFKDGNKLNPEFSNLIIKKRKEYFKGYDWSHARIINDETQKEIIKKYNREEREKHRFIGKWAHPSYHDLAKEYNCSVSTIQKIVNNRYIVERSEV